MITALLIVSALFITTVAGLAFMGVRSIGAVFLAIAMLPVFALLAMVLGG